MRMTVAQHEAEEYLEAIFKLAGEDGIVKTTELASALGVSPASVTEELKRLAENGLVIYTPYKGAKLTKEGLERGRRMSRKHRLLERFLTEHLKFGKDRVHDQACEMEHGLTDEADEALCRMLGGPDTCPHGSSIPPCDADVPSCNECLEKSDEEFAEIGSRKEDLVPLTTLKPGKRAVIAFVRGGKGVIRRLCELGMTPGVEVEIEHSAPLNGPLEIIVRGCKLAIGWGIASKIYVTPHKG